MKLLPIAWIILILVPLTTRSEDVAWVWLKMPPRPTEEIQRIAETQARADIANGAMKVKSFGLQFLEDGDQYRRLLQKYDLTDQNSGCLVDEDTIALTRAYNAMIEAELERRYGKDFWKRFETELEAAKQAAQRRGAVQPNKLLQPTASTNAAAAEQ